MLRKKTLVFVLSTLIALAAFSAIALGIESTGLVSSAPSRLTSCEGQSVLSGVGQEYRSTGTSLLPIIASEERFWQTQAVTSYCIEIHIRQGIGGETRIINVVRNQEIDAALSNCVVVYGDNRCEMLTRALITVDRLFNLLNSFDYADSLFDVSFDTNYGFPITFTTNYRLAFDSESVWELVAFVPLP